MQEESKKVATRIIMGLLALAIGFGSAGCGSGSGAPPPPPPNPAPSVASISPSSAPAGALAFTLTVNGSNFLQSATVDWDGSSRTTTFVSSSQLQAQIMAADLAAAGKVNVTVVNPAPGGGSSNAATFTVLPEPISFQSNRALNGGDAGNAPNGTLNIWVMNPDGSSPTPLTKLTALFANSFAPAVWSPDGSKLVFASQRALDLSDAANTNNTFNIWVINADGSSLTALTKITAAGAGSSQPVWSPDGSKIVFGSSRALDGSNAANTNSTENIWVMNADGSNPTPLTMITAAGGDSLSPLWSPDGSKIVFESSRALDGTDAANANSTSNIWVIHADGSGAAALTKLTATGSSSHDPVWSPDGGKIAFDSLRAVDGSNAGSNPVVSNIWVMSADGSGATALTKSTAAGTSSSSPAWSPDGSKIAFESLRALDGSNTPNAHLTENIWVVNPDGSSPTPLTKITANIADSLNPAWSPGGSKVVFASSRALDGSDAANTNFAQNIWVVNADGTGATPLTKLTAGGVTSNFPEQP